MAMKPPQTITLHLRIVFPVPSRIRRFVAVCLSALEQFQRRRQSRTESIHDDDAHEHENGCGRAGVWPYPPHRQKTHEDSESGKTQKLLHDVRPRQYPDSLGFCMGMQEIREAESSRLDDRTEDILKRKTDYFAGFL
jgi:hypothetical protein